MTKQEIMMDLKQISGSGVITQAEVCRYLRIGKASARKLLDGLCYRSGCGRTRNYFIRDVAQAIYDDRRQ